MSRSPVVGIDSPEGGRRRDTGRGRQLQPDRWALPALRLVLVHAHHFAWFGLRTTLRGEPNAQIIGEVESAHQAARTVARLEPDGVLVGTDVEQLDVITLVEHLRAVAPSSKLIVFGDERDHDLELGLSRAGISGYILWSDVTVDSLHDLLRAVFVSGLHVSSQRAIEELVAAAEPSDLPARCSTREIAVLHHLALGRKEREIAQREGLSDRTVRRIVEGLKTKLEAPTLPVLLARAVVMGLDIDPS